jgi:hypothetical protein
MGKHYQHSIGGHDGALGQDHHVADHKVRRVDDLLHAVPNHAGNLLLVLSSEHRPQRPGRNADTHLLSLQLLELLFLLLVVDRRHHYDNKHGDQNGKTFDPVVTGFLTHLEKLKIKKN